MTKKPDRFEAVARQLYDWSRVSCSVSGAMGLDPIAAWDDVEPGVQAVFKDRARILQSLTHRQCSVCKAIVSTYPEGMCCHCHELPWPLEPTPESEIARLGGVA